MSGPFFMSKPLHYEIDPLTGRVKSWTLNGTTIVQNTIQDTQPLLDHNAILRNDGTATRHGIKNGLWKVGSIPLELCEKWKREEGFDVFSPNVSTAEILARLRRSEYEKLRTTDAKF